MSPGVLILAATPIGNLADAAPRLAGQLAAADVVYAEDTRRSRTLLEALGVDAELRSYFVGNEQQRSSEVEELLSAGRTVALVTDAGTPGVADPGVSAVRAARRAGASVTIVPGPSAVTGAVAVSGFGGDRFVFEGFLPKRGRERQRLLNEIAAETRTVVLFAAPHRLHHDLGDLAEACGPGREVCVVRELTKLHEEVWWGSLDEAVAEWTESRARGEVTVVLAGGEPPRPDPDLAERLARQELAGGATPSEAARRAATETGVPRREIYDRITR